MAHIPYGYRIENGAAVIFTKEAKELKLFFTLYLTGSSIESARKLAGLTVCKTTAGQILGRRVYLGDGYYPQIIDQETFLRVAKERTERCERMNRHPVPKPRSAFPIRTKFKVIVPEDLSFAAQLSPAERAAALYRLILPDEGGEERISKSNEARIRSRLHLAEKGR